MSPVKLKFYILNHIQTKNLKQIIYEKFLNKKQLKLEKKDAYFIIKASLFYGMISSVFAFSGVLLPDKIHLLNPITHGGFDMKEIPGHFLWGFAAGVVTWRLKYALLGGAFAVFVDFDHITSVFQLEAIPHMSHSIAFAGIAFVVMMLVFGKKDYILGVVALSSVLSHISYDLFVSDAKFPLFAPVFDKPIYFVSAYSIFFEIMAMVIVGIISWRLRKNVVKEKSP